MSAPFPDLNMTPQGEAYVRWFHETNVWKNMTWHGVRTLKLPSTTSTDPRWPQTPAPNVTA